MIREMSIEMWAPSEKVWEMLALDRWTEWDLGTQKMVKRVEHTLEIPLKIRLGHLQTRMTSQVAECPTGAFQDWEFSVSLLSPLQFMAA